MTEPNITIRFCSKSDKSFAFNYLIHNKIGFVGVGQNIILLKQSDYVKLGNEGYSFEFIDSTEKV